jgi:hypothetical protein
MTVVSGADYPGSGCVVSFVTAFVKGCTKRTTVPYRFFYPTGFSGTKTDSTSFSVREGLKLSLFQPRPLTTSVIITNSH